MTSRSGIPPRRKPAVRAPILIGLLAVCLQGMPASAETLRQALTSTYNGNPALLAQRKALEATDETVPQARAGFRPRVIGTADIGATDRRSDPASPGDGTTADRGYQITIDQDVFRGFQTINAVRQAEANVLAGRETLRLAEQNTLFSAVTAFMDVIRDRAIARLRENNVRVLARVLTATRDRRDAGDATNTDVAQARARLALAKSDLDLARSNLRTSRGVYQQVIGHMPARLVAPKAPLHLVPATIQVAERRAIEESPSVISAAFLERAAAHNVDQLTGQLLPTANVTASYSNRFEPSPLTTQSETLQVTGQLTFPFYQGGQVYAQIRQARRIREQRGQEIEDARRVARSNLIGTWSVLRAARARLRSDGVQVRANRTALAGVREEERVGQRTLLDVLDAEQELLNSEVSLETTRRDIVVAAYNVLVSTGRLTASDINLHAEQHDPEVHADLVRRKAWGTRTVRDEADEDYVVGPFETTVRDDRNLADDTRRLIDEGLVWLREDRERRAGAPDPRGEPTIEAGWNTETYK